MTKLTYEQVEARKEKAARFVREFLADSKRADEIEDESVEDYANRRGFEITNPNGGVMASKRKQRFPLLNRRFSPGILRNVERRMTMPKSQKERIEELKDEVEELQDENERLQEKLDQIANVVTEDEEEEEGEGEDDEEHDRED